jgi:tRNA(fMet)-specific endonuclease VapC
VVNKALLDTDIFSEISKGKNANVTARARSYLEEYGTFTISVMTVLEVVAGFQKNSRNEEIESFVKNTAQHNLLLIGVDEAALAGRIVGDLDRTGQPIG